MVLYNKKTINTCFNFHVSGMYYVKVDSIDRSVLHSDA